MGISIEFIESDMQKNFCKNNTSTNYDFKNKRDLKKHIKNFKNNFTCPHCNSHRITGEGVIIEFSKVKFHREILKKFFFVKKYTSENFKTIWRIQKTYLRPSRFFTSAGFLKCKTCGWNDTGSGIKYISINEAFNG